MQEQILEELKTIKFQLFITNILLGAIVGILFNILLLK